MSGGERYPLVSILIPNYNYVRYVATAVDSALAQTYPNLEVVVSDNCSTDGAWELLVERYGTNPRVRLHRNERNIGMAGNFDRLMQLARGRYVLCLSSDDFLFPPHVEQLEARFAAEPKLDVVYCTAYFARDDATIFAVRNLPGQFPVDYDDARDELVENLTTVCPLCWPCALFKREVLSPEILGDPENGQTARDWEVVIRLALANKRFGYVARPGMAIRLHADQHTGDEYHRSGRNVIDFAAYVERYLDHPEFVRRMRGHELAVARLLSALVAQAANMNGGTSPFDAEQLAGFTALEQRLVARAEVYEPARVTESRVSVVIEAAGAPQPLLRAIDSVAAQSFGNWELCVVDHGAIPVEPLLRAHPVWERISCVRMPAVQPPGAARNLALRMARGEYLAFLDPNDRFAPDHVARAVETIAREGARAALATSRLVLERTNGSATHVETLGEVVPFGGEAADLAGLEVAHAIPLAALVVYRGMFDRIGRFNESLPILDDWEFALRLARAARIAPTGATTVDLTARLGLVAQRLGAALSQYVPVLDAVYGGYPVAGPDVERRARHRESVATAVGAANDWIAEPRGLAAFMGLLAGRSVAVEA